jgi:hypothetical protein
MQHTWESREMHIKLLSEKPEVNISRDGRIIKDTGCESVGV